MPDKNWLRFNMQGALIANNTISNLYNKDLYPTNQSNAKYTQASNAVSFGFNAGFEFLIGRKKWLKQIVAFNFDLTNSNYKYNFNETDQHLTSYLYITINIL